MPKVSWSANRGKALLRLSASSRRTESHSSLLVHTASRQPSSGKRVQCVLDTWEWPGQVCNVVCIVDQEILIELFEEFGRNLRLL